ncbi:MAG: 30S ribosomal protein S11 [bacterium]|nr:30S ribosomal protein S11 [bacterium]
MLDARDAKAPAKKAKVRSRSRKPRQQTPRGNLYVKASFNNTVVTLTDPLGNTIAWSSAGVCGFRGPKKATPYAASIVVRDVVRKIEQIGLKEVNVFVRGIGSGRESAVRALHANGINVLSIADTTPIPHNGCRPPKPRRI